MNRDRLWVIGAGAGIAVVALLGWFLGISPLVDQASTASAQATSLDQANSDNQAKLATLKTQFDGLTTLQTDLGKLRQSIPTGADIAGFLTEINKYSAADNVKLTSVIVNDATVYAAPAAATPTTTDGSSSTATATATPTPSPSASAATGATTGTPAAPAANSGALVQVPIIINVTGSFDNVMKFTNDLQTGSRLFVANEVATNPADTTSGRTSYGTTLTGFVFSLQGTSGDLPSSVTQVTTPTPAPTDTATPDPTDTATAPPTGAPTGAPTGTATTKP